MNNLNNFASVYGPVKSWRYGVSLGIDPIGKVSTCSFNCVYCQLGEIENITKERKVFVPTEKIINDLKKFAYKDADIITLSGSGEPTLAANLGEIISQLKQFTGKQILVLTNGSLLMEAKVRQDLSLADKVSVKIDAINLDMLQRINRPVESIKIEIILAGVRAFRREFAGKLGIQTMILSPWSDANQAEYIRLMQEIKPNEIQLNTTKRPKPLKHELDARGNHSAPEFRPYEVRVFKCVSLDILQSFAEKIQQLTAIPVRFPG